MQPKEIEIPPPEPPQRQVQLIRVAEAMEKPLETIEEHARRVARETGISGDTLWNLVLAESLGGERMEGDDGDSCGLVHINKHFFPEEHAKCYDNDFSLRFAANLISEGREYLFTSCNCYQYAKYVSGLKFPFMAEILPNTTPFVGSIAIFDYDGIKHVAVVTELNSDHFVVREANYEACKTGSRVIAYDDVALIGFWKPIEEIEEQEDLSHQSQTTIQYDQSKAPDESEPRVQ